VPEPDLDSTYEARLPLLTELAATLEQKAKQALEGVPHIDRVSFRAKGLSSFLKKAGAVDKDGKPKYAVPLAEVEDQVGGRILTFFRSDIPPVRDRVADWFGAIEHQTKEPVESDAFGYESDHYILVINETSKPSHWAEFDDMPATFELQIRTLFMHAWAEPQHDIGYKGEPLDRSIKRELAWAAASAWGADRTFDDIAQRFTTGDHYASSQRRIKRSIRHCSPRNSATIPGCPPRAESSMFWLNGRRQCEQ
jgi:putative GTP pyrophosphokinase